MVFLVIQTGFMREKPRNHELVKTFLFHNRKNVIACDKGIWKIQTMPMAARNPDLSFGEIRTIQFRS